ncbi:MAG: class I SAM-dependent methyltransferase [Fibrobacter sp.]|nr:class I SAM-dependent methyltransferase [Fibrobacter sp.]
MKYEALAPVYDRLMNHVEYDEWVVLIDNVLQKFCQNKNPSILELGGGTGILAGKLLSSGYSYIGSDLSFSMCKQALLKGIPFVCSDCRHIPIDKIFDLIIFLYDGINYLQTLNDYSILFSEVYNHLSVNGLFLFDITTETNSVKYFMDYFDFEDYEDISFVRHSFYDMKNSLQFNEFTIFQRDSQNKNFFRKANEKHIQKVYSVKNIESIIPLDKFKIIGIWDNFSFKKYSQKSERIHFLLKKIA